MYYIYDKTSVQSILENLYVKRYIKHSGRLYEFNVDNNSLMLHVYSEDGPPVLVETYTVEKNIKGEFNICEDEHQGIHIVVANKKYELIYIRFDGETLHKEIVYRFNNNIIPTMPVIQAQNNFIIIVSEFLTVGMQKEWSLRVYIKRNEAWEYHVVDKGTGLCYVQPDFKLDGKNNIHLIYRELKEQSYLKYSTFPILRPKLEKPKIIFENNINKYAPSIFIKDFAEVFLSWVEIHENEADLCCTNISTDFSREIFKLDISRNILDARIYFSGRHIYCIFLNEDGFYYDMCCRRKLVKQWNPKLIPKRGGASMSSDFRLFLDIKRELENRIIELKNTTDSYQYENTINSLKQQNKTLIEQINEKQKEINAAQDEVSFLRSENEEYKNKEALLQQQLKGKQEQEQNQNQNISIWNRLLNFFNS